MAACAFFPQAYHYQGGADMVIGKNIHRESMNLAIANTRGNAKAVNKEWGMIADAWFRTNVWTFHPDELAQLYYTIFFSGAKLITQEASLFALDDKGNAGPNECGAGYLDFARFVKQHPPRGKQSVKIAFMRGAGASGRAIWRYFIRAFNDRPEEVTKVEKDFNLLDMFFCNWGAYSSTYSDRLLTGTPFGPVDIIPWNIKPELLDDYGLVVFANNINFMDQEQYRKLSDYVKQGGTLVMCVSQLKQGKNKYYKMSLEDLFGVVIQGERKLAKNGTGYIKLLALDCNVLEKFPNGDPLLVEKKLGKGVAYLFATDYLTDEENAARRLLGKLAEKNRVIEFSPFNGWLEYMVQKKEDIYIIPVINQGRGKFSSGNGIDQGEWKGKLLIDLNKLDLSGDLEAQKVEWDADTDKFKLTPLALHKQENGKISLDIAVDRWCEILLGRKGKTKHNFFWGN